MLIWLYRVQKECSFIAMDDNDDDGTHRHSHIRILPARAPASIDKAKIHLCVRSIFSSVFLSSSSPSGRRSLVGWFSVEWNFCLETFVFISVVAILFLVWSSSARRYSLPLSPLHSIGTKTKYYRLHVDINRSELGKNAREYMDEWRRGSSDIQRHACVRACWRGRPHCCCLPLHAGMWVCDVPNGSVVAALSYWATHKLDLVCALDPHTHTHSHTPNKIRNLFFYPNNSVDLFMDKS